MSATRLMRQPLELELAGVPGARDDHGVPTSTTTTRRVLGAVQQVAAGERNDRGQIATEDWRAFLPPTVSLTELDSVRILRTGQRFAVDGTPWLVIHERTGQASHVEARLTRRD